MTSALHDAGIAIDRGYPADRRHSAGRVWADWDSGASYVVSGTSGTDGDLDVSIDRGASPGQPDFGHPGSLDLSNSPMNPPTTR